MRTHGWTAVRTAWLITSVDPLTPSQLDAARRAAARSGLVIESRDGKDLFAAFRDGATAFGIVLALAIIAMTVGLLRGESAADLQTLTATGATSRTRRSLAATTASGLALVGVVLGGLVAYGAVAAVYHDRLSRLSPTPWIELVAFVVGFPLAAALGGWTLAGREPRHFTREATE